MSPNHRQWLAAVPVFLAAFGSAHMLVAPSDAAQVERALETVRDDPVNTVCLGGSPCLDAAAGHTLFIFFSDTDCTTSLYETAVLERAYRRVPRHALNVVGVTDGLTRDEAVRFARASGITYPLYLDGPRLKQYVGNPRREGGNRPVSLLLDHGGRVLESSMAGSTVREHEARADRWVRRVAAR